MNQISWYEGNQFLFDTTGFPPMKGDLMVRTNQKNQKTRFRVTEVTRVVTEVKTGLDVLQRHPDYTVEKAFELAETLSSGRINGFTTDMRSLISYVERYEVDVIFEDRG